MSQLDSFIGVRKKLKYHRSVLFFYINDTTFHNGLRLHNRGSIHHEEMSISVAERILSVTHQ